VRQFVISWLAIFLAVLVAGALAPGLIVVGDTGNVAVFALVLGLLNAVVRPIIAFVSLPITCLTLGLFTLVINALMFWLATGLIPWGVSVEGFGGAFVGALIVSVVNLIVNAILDPEGRRLGASER